MGVWPTRSRVGQRSLRPLRPLGGGLSRSGAARRRDGRVGRATGSERVDGAAVQLPRDPTSLFGLPRPASFCRSRDTPLSSSRFTALDCTRDTIPRTPRRRTTRPSMSTSCGRTPSRRNSSPRSSPIADTRRMQRRTSSRETGDSSPDWTVFRSPCVTRCASSTRTRESRLRTARPRLRRRRSTGTRSSTSSIHGRFETRLSPSSTRDAALRDASRKRRRCAPPFAGLLG